VSGQRVITYIDGYNLYHGLLAAGLRSSRWLDLPMLGQSLLKPDQDLELTRYFTTRVRANPGKWGMRLEDIHRRPRSAWWNRDRLRTLPVQAGHLPELRKHLAEE
jgi:hypothetical protein